MELNTKLPWRNIRTDRSLPVQRGNCSGHLSKTFNGKFISTCQMRQGMAAGVNNRHNKKLGRKNWEVRRFGEYGIWNASTRRPTRVCPRQSSCSKTPETALNSHFWLSFRLYTSSRWSLRVSCKLPSWVLEACPNISTGPTAKDFEVFFVCLFLVPNL